MSDEKMISEMMENLKEDRTAMELVLDLLQKAGMELPFAMGLVKQLLEEEAERFLRGEFNFEDYIAPEESSYKA